jgi:hypothetical protein
MIQRLTPALDSQQPIVEEKTLSLTINDDDRRLLVRHNHCHTNGIASSSTCIFILSASLK